MSDTPVTAPTAEPVSEPASVVAPKDDTPLGAPGLAALEAERSARKAAERERATLAAQVADLQSATELEQTKATQALTRVLRAEVKAAAAGKLADPTDALALVDMSELKIDSDGNVDSNAIAAAIDALVTSKPYLAAGATPQPVTGSADGGVREAPPTKSLDEQAAEARAKGDVRTAIRLKNAALFQQS